MPPLQGEVAVRPEGSRVIARPVHRLVVAIRNPLSKCMGYGSPRSLRSLGMTPSFGNLPFFRVIARAVLPPVTIRPHPFPVSTGQGKSSHDVFGNTDNFSPSMLFEMTKNPPAKNTLLTNFLPLGILNLANGSCSASDSRWQRRQNQIPFRPCLPKGGLVIFVALRRDFHP